MHVVYTNMKWENELCPNLKMTKYRFLKVWSDWVAIKGPRSLPSVHTYASRIQHTLK